MWFMEFPRYNLQKEVLDTLLKWYLALLAPLFLQKAAHLSIKHLVIAKTPYPGCSF